MNEELLAEMDAESPPPTDAEVVALAEATANKKVDALAFTKIAPGVSMILLDASSIGRLLGGVK